MKIHSVFFFPGYTLPVCLIARHKEAFYISYHPCQSTFSSFLYFEVEEEEA